MHTNLALVDGLQGAHCDINGLGCRQRVAAAASSQLAHGLCGVLLNPTGCGASYGRVWMAYLLVCSLQWCFSGCMLDVVWS